MTLNNSRVTWSRSDTHRHRVDVKQCLLYSLKTLRNGWPTFLASPFFAILEMLLCLFSRSALLARTLFFIVTLMPFLVWMSSRSSGIVEGMHAPGKKSRAVCVTNWLLFGDKSLAVKMAEFPYTSSSCKHFSRLFYDNGDAAVVMWVTKPARSSLTRLCGKNGNKNCAQKSFSCHFPQKILREEGKHYVNKSAVKCTAAAQAAARSFWSSTPTIPHCTCSRFIFAMLLVTKRIAHGIKRLLTDCGTGLDRGVMERWDRKWCFYLQAEIFQT